MSCRCAIRLLNFYSHPWSHIRVENDFLFRFLVTWTPSIFQGIVNKWYASMWLVKPCRCPMSYILPPGVKIRFFSNNISLTWHGRISFFAIIPLWKKMWPFISTYLSPLYTRSYSVPSLVEIGQVVLEKQIFKSRRCIFSMWLLHVSPLKKMHGP